MNLFHDVEVEWSDLAKAWNRGNFSLGLLRFLEVSASAGTGNTQHADGDQHTSFHGILPHWAHPGPVERLYFMKHAMWSERVIKGL